MGTVCHNASSMKRNYPLAAAACVIFLTCARAASLSDQIGRVAEEAGGRMGVSAVLVETGEHVAWHGDQPFFMASTVKFPVALLVLYLVDEGKLRLDQKIAVTASDRSPGVTTLGGKFRPGAEFTVRDLLGYMILNSDNTACDVLMRISGGPPAVLAKVQELGIQGIRVDRTEKRNSADYDRSHARFIKDIRNTSTPDAMAALLAKFQQGETLKPASTALLRELMEQTTTFPNRIKGQLPPGTVVAHKTGTWGRAATNDVAIITLPGGTKHIAIAIFSNGSKRTLSEVESTIAKISRIVYDHWTP